MFSSKLIQLIKKNLEWLSSVPNVGQLSTSAQPGNTTPKTKSLPQVMTQLRARKPAPSPLSRLRVGRLMDDHDRHAQLGPQKKQRHRLDR